MAGAGATGVYAMTTWEYATVPLTIAAEDNKAAADRWGLFVGEWTPTFFADSRPVGAQLSADGSPGRALQPMLFFSQIMLLAVGR